MQGREGSVVGLSYMASERAVPFYGGGIHTQLEGFLKSQQSIFRVQTGKAAVGNIEYQGRLL